MKLKLIIIFIFLPVIAFAQEMKYAVANEPTPVLNTPDFYSVFGGNTGTTVKTDNKGLIREMEFVALPKTVFEVHEVIPIDESHSMLRVTTQDYQYNGNFYIDSRFVTFYDTKPEGRFREKPSAQQIQMNLEKMVGDPYMWGGNYTQGIAKLLELYKPSASLDDYTKSMWCLEGVDCSGLIYQATGGWTPRNTSSLVTYGDAVAIQGIRSAENLNQLLLPLDLIVWNGHVVIVLDENHTIESTPSGGVHKRNRIDRISEIMSERKPVDDWNGSSAKRFVVRRFAD